MRRYPLIFAPIALVAAFLLGPVDAAPAGAATAQAAPAIQPLASVPPACNGGAGWCPYSTSWASGRVSGTDCYVNGRLELSHKFVAKWQSTSCQSYTAKVTTYIYASQSGWTTTDSTLLLNTTTTRSVPQGYHICYVYIALYNAYGVFVGDLVYYRGISGNNAYPYML